MRSLTDWMRNQYIALISIAWRVGFFWAWLCYRHSVGAFLLFVGVLSLRSEAEDDACMQSACLVEHSLRLSMPLFNGDGII